MLQLVMDYEIRGENLEWQENDPYEKSTAVFRVERVDRETNTSTFDTVWQPRVRVATVKACLRWGWLDDLHRREYHYRQLYYGGQKSKRCTWNLTQLDTTEDGIIALGLWRERKLNAPPPPMPELADEEREIVQLANRALELGYALSPREPARKQARRLIRDGWFETCHIANSAYGLVPTAMAYVEIKPENADEDVTNTWQ